MPYKLALIVAIIGLILYFSGYAQGSFAMQASGVALTGSMFAVYMVKRFNRR